MLLDVPTFESFDGVELSYDVEGDGAPVLLLHGYAADAYTNWVRPGVVDKLASGGYRAITLDQRGHGQSEKPHDPAAYADEAMVRDAQALLDHLSLDRCLCAGYSMGARTTLGLLLRDERPRAAVLGGVGSNMLEAREWGGAIADAMVAPDPNAIGNRFAKSFRDFADLTRADREALAAIMRNPRPPFSNLDRVAIPVLVLCGDNDPLAGDPKDLAGAMQNARAAVVGGTHLNVVNNVEFHRELVAFLDEARANLEDG